MSGEGSVQELTNDEDGKRPDGLELDKQICFGMRRIAGASRKPQDVVRVQELLERRAKLMFAAFRAEVRPKKAS